MHNGADMDAHIFCDLTVVHLFKCIFNLGPRAVYMLRALRHLNLVLGATHTSRYMSISGQR